MRHKANLRHILTSKAKKRKKQAGPDATLVSDGDYKKVARMIPYYVMERRASLGPSTTKSAESRRAPQRRVKRSGFRNPASSGSVVEASLPPAARRNKKGEQQCLV